MAVSLGEAQPLPRLMEDPGSCSSLRMMPGPQPQEQRHGAHLQQLVLLQSSSSLPAQQTVQ